MTEIAVRHEGGPLESKIKYAHALAGANLLPASYRNQPANVLLAIELGEALGIPSIQAINGIHVIEGKPSASADLIASLVRRAGHKLRVTVNDEEGYAVAQIIRADDEDFVYEARWDEKKARAAGLWGKGNWAKHPGQMMRSRAITEVCRMGASDALYGVIYDPEELGADLTPEGNVVASQVAASSLRPMDDPYAAKPPSIQDAIAEREAVAAAWEQPPEHVPDHHPSDGYDAARTLRTDKQSAKLHALLNERGMGGAAHRDEALAYCSEITGRKVDSTKDLTVLEASNVIEALAGGVVVGEPVTA
jgi:hypothetical protein